MNRASPVQLRLMLQMANDLAKAGVLFVPMPVSSTEEFIARNAEVAERLEQMEKEAESPA